MGSDEGRRQEGRAGAHDGRDESGRNALGREEWERGALEMLSHLRVLERLVGERELHCLVERTLDRVDDAVMLSDAGEFATQVLFGQFVVPVLDLLAAALDLEAGAWPEAGEGPPLARARRPDFER
ncbi:MAG: hypothetical protein R3F35_05920 [Myxococcota bacterium]